MTLVGVLFKLKRLGLYKINQLCEGEHGSTETSHLIRISGHWWVCATLQGIPD